MRRTLLLVLLPLVACSSPAVTDDAGPIGSNDAGKTQDAAQTKDAAADAKTTPDASQQADGSTSTDDAGDDASTGTQDAGADVVVVNDGGSGCTLNSECSSTYYCAKAVADCTGSDGVCAVRPQLCPFTYVPVCGCNAVTYDNDCLAHSAGINILHDGSCP